MTIPKWAKTTDGGIDGSKCYGDHILGLGGYSGFGYGRAWGVGCGDYGYGQQNGGGCTEQYTAVYAKQVMQKDVIK